MLRPLLSRASQINPIRRLYAIHDALPVTHVPIRTAISKHDLFPPILIEPGHKARVIDFLCQNYITTEPLCKSLQLTPHEAIPYLEDVFDDCCRFEASFLAYDLEHQTVGVKLNTIRDFGNTTDSVENEMMNNHGKNYEKYTEKVKYMAQFLAQLECPLPYVKFERTHAPVQKWLKLCITGVQPGHKQQYYITEKLWQLTLMKLKERQIDALYAPITSVPDYSILVGKFKFQNAHTLCHEHFLDENGDRIFKCGFGNEGSYLGVRKVTEDELEGFGPVYPFPVLG